MKFLRYLQKKRRAMLAMAAFTLFAYPFSAQASTITTKDGKTLTPNNNVYNIEVQKKLSKQVGVNKFKDFSLDKGHIANMQFDKLQTLANLVDNKININGTVNALRGGKIGGNLYFLSPNGIAVGASGVINAGSFTGAAVDKSYFDKLSGITSASDFMVQLAPKNIVCNNDPDKGIDIQGVINAPGGIALYATKIDIGKDAVLRTDVSKVDFKKVVNVEGVDSGITGGLDAFYKDGDIILKAHAEHVAGDNTFKQITQETATQWEKITERTATVNVDGTILSANDVSITADAKTTFSEGSYFNVISQSGMVDAFLGSLGIDCAVDFAKKDNAAEVNINKSANITSAGNIDISANAELNVSINAITPAKSGTTSATDWIPATAVSVISATNKATVNVDGNLSSGGTMAINATADSSLSSTAQSKTSVATAAQKKGLKEDPMYIGVSVVVGENDAEVNINAGDKITAGGEDVIKSGKIDTHAFEANAKSKNSVSSTAAAANVKPGSSQGSDIANTARDDSAVNTSVNVVSYSDKAVVNVNRDIETKNGSVGLSAINDISNSASSSTTIGKEITPFKNTFFIDAPDALNSLSNNLAKRVTSKLQKNLDAVPNEAGGSTLSKIFNGEYFKTGIAVGVFEQDNISKINVGSNANLTAKKNIDLNAKTNISSLGLSVDSTVNNQSKNQKTNAMIGLGVLVSDINNDADILVDGNLINTDASGSVNLKTDSGMDYNQFYAVTDSIKNAFLNIKDDAVAFGGKVADAVSSYDKQVSDELSDLENTDDPDEYMTRLTALNEKIEDTTTTELSAAVEALDDGAKLKKDLESLPSTLLSILSPSSYANYYATAAFFDSKKANDSSSSKIDAAGAFSINNMTNNSRIALNKSAAITAKGNVDINTLAKNRVVAITGMGGPHLTSSEASNKGVGISVKVAKFDNNSLIAVGNKAKISGNDIKINSDEKSKHVNIIYGNGKADSTTVTGMVSVIRTPTDSIVSLNESTNLNAGGNLELGATTEDYITSVNGGLTMGNGGGKSFGAAINILTNDKNTAVHVADNHARNSNFDKNINALNSQIKTLQDDIKAATDADVINSKKADIKSLEITKRTHNILGEDYFSMLGDMTNTGGLIDASELSVKVNNQGTINAIAIEGTENAESHKFADQFNDKVYKGETAINFAGDAFKYPSNLLSKSLGKKINDKLNKSGQQNAGNAANNAAQGAGNDNGINPGVDNQQVQSQLNVAGAGSVAVNITGGETGAIINNTKINADTVNISAEDDVFHGSWAGAGAFNFFGNSQAAKNTNVAIGGAVAYTDTSQNVDAIIKNTDITAKTINNSASRADSDVSAGMGLAVSKNKGNEGTNVDVAISASINFINGDTHALLINNNGKNSAINNSATINSLQVAGGLDIAASGGGKGFNIGGSAAASKITNDLQSGISGGSYDNLGNVDITATKKTNQVDVAVAGGITTGSNTKGFSFGGGVAVSDINNNSRAFLDGTTNFNSSGTVNIDALDVKNSNSRKEYLSARSINTDAASYLDSSDKSKLNGGSTIVNVALGGGASTGESGSAGLGVSYNGLENIMNVSMSDNNSITAKNINTNSANASEIVNVTLGLAGSNKSFSGAGSAGITDLKNDSVIKISDSNITADKFSNSATGDADIVNVAGQAALASKFAGGLTFAYNAMNNTAETNIKGGTLNVGNFDAIANNDNYTFGLGAGVSYSKNSSALNGSVALNMGTNSTKAIVDGSTINNLNAMNITATDKTSKTTIAGGVIISSGGNVAAGGAVAYANIGTASNKEILNAKIINSDIGTRDEGLGTSVNVETADKSTMTTVGVGVGGSTSSGKLTFQGAAAVSELNKDNIAEVANTTLDKGTTGTGNANLNIKATSGGNSSNGLNLGDKNIDVDNKVNTAAAVLDANFSSESWFNGALAISVNKFNQKTQANLKSDTLSADTAIRAGNIDMYSNSEGDILGVALGGAGGKSAVSAAGSVSYNYIDNSAQSLVEKENVKAAKNFGVVAQSDDMIANYAGAVDVDVKGYGSIGVSVAYNEIKGNTDALINNSKLEVTGSDSDLIAISNPKDKLIDDYVTKNTWTSGGLMSGRTTDKKSGLVVNSSATHSISSDLATIGIRASTSKPGVGVSGTVNINKISGATESAIRNVELGIRNDNAFVNAADYTNNGSFVGNAAVSGTVAVGFLWNENQIDRKTNALIDGGTLNVKNLDVKADNRQGLSNLNIAVGAAFSASKDQVFAAASGDNVVRNQMEGTTTAKIENATVNHSGAVNVDAYHKDNAFATNIAVGVAIDTNSAGATFDLGYGLMRENSTVEAQINNSTLTSENGAVKVNAENNSKLAGAFGTMGIAAHAGEKPGLAASVALGINNNYVTNKVNAGIKNSTLDVGAVDVDAKNTSEIKADGGVAAVAINISESFFAALGAAVAVTNATFDNKVTAEVDNSAITAAGDVNINARDDHKSDETVVAAALSTGLAVSVNRMSTSVNSGLANLKENQLGKAVSDNDMKMTTDNAGASNAKSDTDKLNGEFGSEDGFLNEDAIKDLLGGVHTDSSATKENITAALTKRYKATVNYNNSLKNGVFANVQNNSTIDAGANKIKIGSAENNDLSVTSGSGSGGIAGIGVGSTTIETRRANTTNVIGSTLNAKNIELSTTNGQTGSDGINSKIYNATLAGLGVSVGYNNVETNGTGEIVISNSKITAAENLDAKAIDNSKSKSYILDAGLKIVGYTGVFAYNTNTAQTGIEVSNKSALSANAINFNAENHTYRATDTLAISASGLGVQTTTSEAKDTSKNFINVTGAGNTFTADNLTFNALNGSQTYAHTNGQAYLGLNVVVADGLANTNSTAKIAIDDANTFANTTANITAQIGEEGKYTAESTGFAINGSALGINVDEMTAQTKSTAQVNIGNEYYGDATTLNVTALNKASRNAFMRNNAYAIVANANDISAYTKAEDNATITIGGDTTLENANKLVSLNIMTDSDNKSYVAATGTGGAIGGDFGSAAHADNDVNNKSTATIKGTWNIANDLTLTANQHDSAYISGYSARGAILTGGKGSLDNVIKGTSTAKISDSAQINAQTVNVNSKNFITTDKYSDDYDYTLFGRMGGVVDDVDYQRSTATTNKSANINIGNAAITTTGKQNYDTANDFDLKNNVYGEGGSLLASLRWVKSHNYITANENITVDAGAILKNEGGTYKDGGINLAANDKLEGNMRSEGFSQSGFGGYVRAETLLDINRNRNITVNGTLKSAKDLNLYAGADSKAYAYAQAISQVQTFFSDGSADIIRKGTTKSNVNVNSGATGQAAHDINITADAGNDVYEEMTFYGSTWSSDTNYKVATSDKGNVTSADYKNDNKVKVDGELKAAATPDIAINISGVALPDGFILANSNLKNLSYSVTSGDITISKKNTDFTGKSSEEIFAQQIYNGITTKTTDYANDYLLTRYKEVEKLLGEYSGNAAAYSGFQQEKLALEAEMIKLGMGSYTTRSNGRKEFIFGATPSIKIKALVLPDIEVSGGSINVVTDNLTGSGKLNASGVPKIDIQNDSTAYLITNRLTIGDKGGAINYKGQEVSTNAAINELNSTKSGASFAALNVADAGEVPTIEVSNNYAGQGSIPMKANPDAAKNYSRLPAAAMTATFKYTPINYIEITADIDNSVGKAIINNNQGSIRINSGANVNAMDIKMTAKDSISQGYTDGIVNIAYSPEYAYAAAAEKLRTSVGWDSTMPDNNQSVTKTYNDMYKGGEDRISGDAIYISAREININGLIQSGYNGFKATITQADLDNATETTYFNGELMYKVNDGGKKLGDNGYYIYEPQVYYDKADNKIYVEDINSDGGKIYLAGRILSTGNGKIVVSDGASNIDITNKSSADMNIGKVTSTTGNGFIQIVDTAQDKLTEYSTGQTRTINNYSAWLADNTKGKVTTGDGLKLGTFTNYNPADGLTYRWAQGMSQTTTYHYHKEEIRGRWGNADDPNYSGKYEDMSNTYNETSKKEGDKSPLGEGVQIYTAPQSEVLKLYAQNQVGSVSYGIDRSAADYTTSGFFGYYHHHQHYWNKKVGTTQTYIFSAKADHPISIGIIGEKNPTINLANTATTGGDLHLTGDIRNDTAKLNIKAAGGDIVQEGGVKVSTDNINLTAQNHIKNINISKSGGTVKLSAISTSNAGDIDINVTGNTTVNALKSTGGSVNLTSSGDIKQSITGTTLAAQNIKLESTGGSINLQIESPGQAIATDKAAISAAAQGDITLIKNDDNDFRIGSIVSTQGDVNLTAGGKFVDALDKVNDNAANDENALVKAWIDMGLIAGTDDYKGAYLTNLERDRDNYKADVTEQFAEYQTLLAAYNESLKKFSTLEMGDRLELLNKKFGKYATADAYLAADADYQTLVSTAANPQYQWTADDLLNGIRGAIVNKTSGSSEDVTKLKDANITARNVTLTGAGVGTNTGETATIKLSELSMKDNETAEEKSARLAALKKLANAEAADVEVIFAKNPDGTYKTTTTTRVNYNCDADKGYYIDTSGNYVRYRKDADGNLLKYTYDKDLNQIGEAATVSDFSDVIKSTTTIENKEIESFEISGKIPLGINATGNITVKTTGDDGIYIAGRNKGVKIDAATNPNNNVYSALNINKIETRKTDGNFADVRIIGQSGVFNAADSGANVIGKDLILVGGDGAIGTEVKPFTVQLTGDLLSARSNEDINLAKTGADDFRISAIYSPKDINITNDGNGSIQRSLRFDEIEESYINTPGTLTINGTAGTASSPINILPHATTVINLLGNDSEFYIKGVNDGVLTLGDVITDKDASISSEGSIAQADGKSLDVKKITLSAAKDITLENDRNDIETLVLNTLDDKKNIGGFKLNSLSTNGLTVEGDFKTTGDVAITSNKSLTLNGAIESDKNIALTAGTDLTSNENSLLKAAETIKLVADDINLAGKVKLNAFDETGEIKVAIVDVTTGNGLVMSNADNEISILKVQSSDGNDIKGAVNVVNNSDMFSAHINNDIKSDLTLTNKKAGGWLVLINDNNQLLTVGGKVNLDMNGDFLRSGVLRGSNDINITSRNGSIDIFNFNTEDNSETIKTTKNLNINAAGEVFVNGKVTAGGDINITSGNDGIEVADEGNINADNNLTLTAGGTGDIDIDGYVWAHKGGITLSAENGNIELGEERNSSNAITAAQDINVTAQNGAIKIKGKTGSDSGNVNIKSNNGEITVSNAGDVTAGNNLTIAADGTGNIDIDGYVKASAGSINMSTATGNIDVGEANQSKETVIAEQDVNVTTQNGSINIKGDISAKGKINITANVGGDDSVLNFAKTMVNANTSDDAATEMSNIAVNAALVANTDVLIKTASGNIDVTESITTTQGSIDIETGAGDITIADNGADNMLSSQNNLVIKTGLGAIKLSGKISSQDGGITLTASQDSYTAGQSNIILDKNGAINSGGNVQLTDRNGDIHINQKIITGNDLTADIYEAGTVYFDETLNVPGAVSVTVEDGNIIQSNRLTAGGEVYILNGTGNIELDKVTAEDANITAINGDISANRITAEDTVTIELERGNLQLNLAKGEGVVILTGNENSKATVNTIRADSASYDKNIVNVRSVLPFQSIPRSSSSGSSRSFSTPAYTFSNSGGTSTARTSTASNYFGNSVYNFGTLTPTLTTSPALTTASFSDDYSFSEFNSVADIVSYRLARNYFELRFAPTWFDDEFLSVNFEDSFGMRNATADELTID